MIEKILERLEERCDIIHEKEEYLPFSRVLVKSRSTFEKDYDTQISIKEAISIVQEVAKEYGNGWIPVEERLPENECSVLVVLGYTYSPMVADYGIARLLKFDNGESHWCENNYGYLEWDKYSDNHGGCSAYKVIAWKPIAPYQKGE